MSDPISAPPRPNLVAAAGPDGIIARGQILVLGRASGVFGEFFVAPTGKPKKSETFANTDDGWTRAWVVLQTGDPAAAIAYRERVAEEAKQERERFERAAVLPVREPPLPTGKAVRTNPDTELEDLERTAFAVVTGCAYVTGYGHHIDTLARLTNAKMLFLLDRIEIRGSGWNRHVEQFGLQDVLRLAVDGPGEQTSGGGFVGGGFGVVGIAEGMLMAAALNAITTRRTVRTFIEIHTRQRHSVWITEKATPAEMHVLLKPVHARIRELAEPDQTDPVARLERLATLRDRSALTDTEFQLAKAYVLRGFEA